MNTFFHRFDLVPILAAGDALSLPTPSSFASVGWLLVGVWTLVKIADSLINFYKRHIKQSIPSGDWVTIDMFEKLEKKIDNQLTEKGSYLHDEVHAMNARLQQIQSGGEIGREALQSRINTLVEVVYDLRGQNSGMLAAQKTSADAAERAAQQAERAASRADELARQQH